MTPTLAFGGTTWSSAAAPPHPQPPCAPHHLPMAPSAAPRLRRWRPRRTAATVMTQRSDIEAQNFTELHFKGLTNVMWRLMLKRWRYFFFLCVCLCPITDRRHSVPFLSVQTHCSNDALWEHGHYRVSCFGAWQDQPRSIQVGHILQNAHTFPLVIGT